MNAVRSSAKAILIRAGELLVVRNADAQGEWLSLPGGGQHPGETLVHALQRECREELGMEIEVGRLRYVREYIGMNHEFAALDREDHKVDHIFECQVRSQRANPPPEGPDPGQIGWAWVPLDELHSKPLFPRILRELLQNDRNPDEVTYLGDVN